MNETTDPVRVVAQAVAELRRRRGLNATELGDLLSEQGVKWDRFTVANLENGRRQNLTISELLALAVVLDVPLLSLLTPRSGRVQVTSNRSVDGLGLVSWADGTRALNGLPTGYFRHEAERLKGYRVAAAAIDAAKASSLVANQARGTADESDAARLRDRHFEELARALEPLLRESAVIPAGVPLGWLTMLAARGWLDASLVPAEETTALEEFDREAGQGGEYEHPEAPER